MSKEYIGKILKTYREKRNISVNEVSTRVNKSVKTIYGWESGHSQPDVDVLLLLCNMYGIDDFDILREHKQCSIFINHDCAEHDLTTKQDQMLIKKYRTLDEKGKHTVDVVLDMEHNRCTEMTTLRIAGRDGIIEDKIVNKAEIDRALALLKAK